MAHGLTSSWSQLLALLIAKLLIFQCAQSHALALRFHHRIMLSQKNTTSGGHQQKLMPSTPDPLKNALDQSASAMPPLAITLKRKVAVQAATAVSNALQRLKDLKTGHKTASKAPIRPNPVVDCKRHPALCPSEPCDVWRPEVMDK